MATKHRTGHLFKRGENFYVRWAVEGKIFSKALRDGKGQPITARREAEEARQKVMAPFVVGDEAAALESIVGRLEGRRAEVAKFDEQQNPPLTMVQAWSAFLASANRPDSGQRTLSQYEGQWTAFKKWLEEKYPGALALRSVSKAIAEEYAVQLNHGRLSANSYNKHLNLLSLVFRVLKGKAKLVENPWGEIPRKRLVTHSRRELTLEELRRVCQQATGELRTLLALGVYSGLRLGDCATLRWCEVELERGFIRRIPNKTARQHPQPVIVPLHPVLRELLSEVPANGRGEYVLPETAALYKKCLNNLTNRVQGHFRACGITLYKPGTGQAGKRAIVEVGFHSLRHTFVSLCRESDAPLAVVEALVGHGNPAMTRHYTHVGEAAAGKAVAALPWVIGQEPGKSSPKGKDRATGLGQIRRILQGMKGTNWKARRAEALNLLRALETAPAHG